MRQVHSHVVLISGRELCRKQRLVCTSNANMSSQYSPKRKSKYRNTGTLSCRMVRPLHNLGNHIFLNLERGQYRLASIDGRPKGGSERTRCSKQPRWQKGLQENNWVIYSKVERNSNARKRYHKPRKQRAANRTKHQTSILEQPRQSSDDGHDRIRS